MEEKKLSPRPADEAAELSDETLDAVAGGGKHDSGQKGQRGVDDSNHGINMPTPR